MDWWIIGFVLLGVGIAIPVVFVLYKFVLVSIPWYWRASIICIMGGVLTMVFAALKDKLGSPSPEKKV